MHVNDLFNYVLNASKKTNKVLGQNYLINKDISKKITDLLDINDNDNVLEIGSGFGSLSFFLLKNNYKTLTLNDINDEAISFLEQLIKNKNNVYIIKKSILKLNISTYNKIVSNIPYYLTNNLLEYVLTRSNSAKYVFMVQKEAFDRINAKINTKLYGPLSVFVSCLGQLNMNFFVSNVNFRPIPNVYSVVFSINNLSKKIKDKQCFLQFLKKIFMHRRKTIFNNLFLYLKDKEKTKKILNKINIPLKNRPENIKPDIYLCLFNLIKSLN